MHAIMSNPLFDVSRLLVFVQSLCQQSHGVKDLITKDFRPVEVPTWEDECFEQDTQYLPLDMEGHGIRIHWTKEGCQKRCASITGCAHFSWKRPICHVQDNSAYSTSEPGFLAGRPRCSKRKAETCNEFHCPVGQIKRRGAHKKTNPSNKVCCEGKLSLGDTNCWERSRSVEENDAFCEGSLVCARNGFDGRNFGYCSSSVLLEAYGESEHCCSVVPKPVTPEVTTAPITATTTATSTRHEIEDVYHKAESSMTTTRVFLEVEDDPASSMSSPRSPAMPTSSTREMFDVKEDSSPQTSTGSPSNITSAINEVEVQDDSTPQTSTVSSKNVTPGADTTGGLGGEDDVPPHSATPTTTTSRGTVARDAQPNATSDKASKQAASTASAEILSIWESDKKAIITMGSVVGGIMFFAVLHWCIKGGRNDSWDENALEIQSPP